jgi:hypothetical protein
MPFLPNLGALSMRALAAVPTGATGDEQPNRGDNVDTTTQEKKKQKRAPTAPTAPADGRKRPPGKSSDGRPSKRAQRDAAATKFDDEFREEMKKKVPTDNKDVQVDANVKRRNGYWLPDRDDDEELLDPPKQKPCCTHNPTR